MISLEEGILCALVAGRNEEYCESDVEFQIDSENDTTVELTIQNGIATEVSLPKKK